MSRGLARAERLREMELLYVQRAFSDQEMAERLGVTRSTVWKDRELLGGQGLFVADEHGRWRIDRRRYISEVRLNLYEALALYLAARRATRQTQSARRHSAGALSKLATALQQPMTQRLVAAAAAVEEQGGPHDRTAVLEVIAQAWAERLRVRLVYRRLEAIAPKTHLVDPYLIEPSQWSDSVYVIGRSDLSRSVIPFKIERVERATLTTERFEPPDDFDEARLLQHAWGIWYAAREPLTVRLRFAPGRAAQRLRESVWHPLQVLSDTADGGCVWECAVDEWQEMLPWVRGWGADCEVLAPAELRETLIGESKALAEGYGWFVAAQQGQEPPSAAAEFFGLF